MTQIFKNTIHETAGRLEIYAGLIHIAWQFIVLGCLEIECAYIAAQLYATDDNQYNTF